MKDRLAFAAFLAAMIIANNFYAHNKITSGNIWMGAALAIQIVRYL